MRNKLVCLVAGRAGISSLCQQFREFRSSFPWESVQDNAITLKELLLGLLA